MVAQRGLTNRCDCAAIVGVVGQPPVRKHGGIVAADPGGAREDLEVGRRAEHRVE